MSIPIKDFQVKPLLKCRVCQGMKLNLIFDLGLHYISDFVTSPTEDHPKAPLELHRCQDCRLVQLGHTTTQELLYRRFYWYRSGVTETMKRSLKDITEHAKKFVTPRSGDIVIDIGSNDGTLLRTYSEKGIIKLGVEPAKNLKKEGQRGLDYFINDFWSYENIKGFLGRKKAMIITAIGMLYDLDSPLDFIKDIFFALDDEGVFVVQLMCLSDMIETKDIGNINHEHLEYYTLKDLINLFDRVGLSVVEVSKNTTNNKSTRITCVKKGSKLEKGKDRDHLKIMLKQDEEATDQLALDAFFKDVKALKKTCVDFIKQEVSRGKRVWVYGASTKGNTILQYYGLNSELIEKAAERSAEKWGRYTVGSNILCVSENEAREQKPDYFLVLPYTFINEMIVREKDWLASGGRFIVPLPNFRIIP